MKRETFDQAFRLIHKEDQISSDIEALTRAMNSNTLFSIHCNVGGNPRIISLEERGSRESIIPFAINWFEGELAKTRSDFDNLKDN
jgi:hypothetical protein